MWIFHVNVVVQQGLNKSDGQLMVKNTQDKTKMTITNLRHGNIWILEICE